MKTASPGQICNVPNGRTQCTVWTDVKVNGVQRMELGYYWPCANISLNGIIQNVDICLLLRQTFFFFVCNFCWCHITGLPCFPDPSTALYNVIWTWFRNNWMCWNPFFCRQTIYTLLGFWISHWVRLQRWKMGSGPLQTCQLCTLGTLSAWNKQLSFVIFTDWPITDHSNLMWITLTYISDSFFIWVSILSQVPTQIERKQVGHVGFE